MAELNDAGYARISRRGDGVQVVDVGMAVRNGKVRQLIAQHVGVANLVIDPRIAWDADGAAQVTREAVFVSDDRSGTVRIDAIPDAGLID
ncbi:MAG TPA: hypothetical protein VF101_04750 [Gaiellaceae bacterium]